MEHFAGLDVSVNETSVCIVDDMGRVVREAKVASEPEALLAVLKDGARTTSSGSAWKPGRCRSWLYSALAEANLPVICVETRHMRAVLKAQINKTDRNDARGMAQRSTQNLQKSTKIARPITPSIGKADICFASHMSAFGDKADIGLCAANVCF